MEEWIRLNIYLLIFIINPVLTSVKGGEVEKAGEKHIDMNIRADDTLFKNSTSVSSATDVHTFANTTSGVRNTTSERSSHSSDNGDNGMVVIYTAVPIAIFILAGITLVSILMVRRRRRQRQDESINIKGDNHDPKKENNNNAGVANHGFSDQQETRKDNTSVPSLYTEIEEEKSNIYYEYEGDHRKIPESLYYDYNKSDPRLEGIVEDEFGYGQFNTKVEPLTTVDNMYQNLTNLKNNPSDEIYPGTETDSPPLYTNCAEMSVVPELNATKERNSDDEDDPLYDHAKAGGHEWHIKEKDNALYVNDEIVNQKCSTLQHNYENNSNEKYLASDDEWNGDSDTDEEEGKTPVYLELEADEGGHESTSCRQCQEADEKLPLPNTVYDYAFVDEIHKDVIGDEIKTLSLENSDGTDNSLRQYFILEKENTIQVDNNEYEFTSNHEYFILEKVER